jgi:hypothetical protein
MKPVLESEIALAVRRGDMDRQEGLRRIIQRCAVLQHDMGDWEVHTIEGFGFLRSTCRRCHATVLAELDGRLVPGGSAVTVSCLPVAQLVGQR